MYPYLTSVQSIAKSIVYGKCELKFQKFFFISFMVGNFCGQFGTEAVCFGLMLKVF